MQPIEFHHIPLLVAQFVAGLIVGFAGLSIGLVVVSVALRLVRK